jgi:hypothetical protein
LYAAEQRNEGWSELKVIRRDVIDFSATRNCIVVQDGGGRISGGYREAVFPLRIVTLSGTSEVLDLGMRGLAEMFRVASGTDNNIHILSLDRADRGGVVLLYKEFRCN